MTLNISGVLVAAGATVVIGFLHIAVVKCEYHIGKKIWPVFLILGLACVILSLFLKSEVASISLALLGFFLLWCIGELFKQEKRVEKGWYPKKRNK
ncbi:MAG: DUF4491 family protein [Clostridiales Family XIII bacterium]|jgi:hypothetical protein|nr:DUF4491 family protein [Clostridiales Family XIII bacterium]